MAIWLYKGQTTSGNEVNGEIEAANKEDARALLRKKRIVVNRLGKKPIEININFSQGVGIKDLARFTRQFSAMNSAGLPLIQCLETLAAQTENENLKKAIIQISSDIQGGSTLADALKKHPKIFTDLYCHMISAGEAGGILDTILNRLADYQEKTEKLIRKIKKAMYYPVFVLLVSVVVIVVLLMKVVPTFAQMFSDMGGTLPTPTVVVMAMSSFLQANFFYMLIATSAMIFGVARYYKTEKGRFNVDKLLLTLPISGDLVRKSAVARFTRTLGTLLNAGVPIIDSLRITSRTAGNKVVEEGILNALDSITAGQTIAEPLKETGIFPPMVIQMIAIGEKTGGLADMLSRVSDFFEDEVDVAVDGIASLMEPLIIVFLGGIIGGVLIAMYLPMFDMATMAG